MYPYLDRTIILGNRRISQKRKKYIKKTWKHAKIPRFSAYQQKKKSTAQLQSRGRFIFILG